MSNNDWISPCKNKRSFSCEVIWTKKYANENWRFSCSCVPFLSVQTPNKFVNICRPFDWCRRIHVWNKADLDHCRQAVYRSVYSLKICHSLKVAVLWISLRQCLTLTIWICSMAWSCFQNNRKSGWRCLPEHWFPVCAIWNREKKNNAFLYSIFVCGCNWTPGNRSANGRLQRCLESLCLFFWKQSFVIEAVFVWILSSLLLHLSALTYSPSARSIGNRGESALPGSRFWSS